MNGRAEELVTGLLEDERFSRGQLQQLREQIEKSLGPQRPGEKKPRKEGK